MPLERNNDRQQAPLPCLPTKNSEHECRKSHGGFDSSQSSRESLISSKEPMDQTPDSEESQQQASSSDLVLVSSIKNTSEGPNLPTNFSGPLTLKFAMHRFFTFPPNHKLKAMRLELVSSGFYLTENQCVQCHHCTLKIEKLFLNSSSCINVDDEHRKLNPDCPLMKNEEDLEDIPITDATNYRYEAHRLYSLLSTEWKAPVTQYDLAKHGFYWTGSVDNCRCAFCRLEVRGWEPGDTAASEHRRWNPNCVFMNNRPVGNVPIGNELGNDSIQEDSGPSNISTLSINPFARSELKSYGNITYTKGARKVPLEILGVTPINPVCHPDFLTQGKRFDSFKMWPRCLTQKPKMLAEAGFYYTGTGDRVICFQCGGGLKDWADIDTPWVEHAKWFSKCPYLLLKKGKTFVDDTLKDQKMEMPVQHAVEVFKNSLKSEAKKYKERMDKEGCAGKNLPSAEGKLPAGSLLCVLCCKKDVETVYLPCGHVVACMDCVETRDNCIRCNLPKIAYVRTFLQ